MPAHRKLLLCLAALPAAALRLQGGAGDAADGYYWPQPRGQPGRYSTSPFKAPRNVSQSTLAWAWTNGGAKGKYSTAAHSGLVMDNEQGIYLSSTDGIRKFSANGTNLWHAPMATWRIPALSNGKVYVTNTKGEVVALSMETGQPLWSSKFTDTVGTDISGVAVIDGLIVAESKGQMAGGAAAVAGLDANDGHLLWEFKTMSQLWNFMPMDTGNGSFVFQDQIGGVYHLRTRDGQLLWHSGYSGAWADHFTDGLAMVADGMVYAVHSEGKSIKSAQKSTLRAYELASGKESWHQDFPYPANSQPVIAHLGKGVGLSDRLALVMPIGAQPVPFGGRHYHSAIRAFDAKTGEPIWEFTPPVWNSSFVAGDLKRIRHATLCLPNPYGSPSVDARGTVYTGHFNGMIYAIRDDNGDGKIQDAEVSSYDTGAGFSHGGAVIAPGTLAIASCDGLYVFRE